MKIIRKFYDGMATDGSGGSIQEKKSDEYEQAIKRGGKIYADAYIEGFVDGYTDRHIEAWEHDNQLSAPLSVGEGKDAIAFAEWVDNNFWFQHSDTRLWWNSENLQLPENITSPQLYQLFKDSIK